ncbi:MAG: hypothetical protein FJ267_03475, partial [Planctomycetes bacterium]|nr:hypothetical protein [Planctomycetota bacterium]
MANPKGGKGSTGPTKEELSIATQMAGMLSQMAMTSDRIARSFETQADATKRMSENMQGSADVVSQLTEVNKTLKEIASSLQGLNESSAAAFAAMATNAGTATEATGKLGDAAKKAAGAIGEQTTSLQDLQKKLGATGKDSLSTKQKMAALGEYLEKDFPVATGAALGALSGLKQGFSNLMAMGSGILGFASSIAGAIFEIGKSIITIPFKLFDGLVNMAKKGMGGISEYAQAINNLRKEFGALNGPLTSTIKSVAHDMKGFSDSGLSAFSVFGNVAERMEHLIKLFSAGGAILQKFTQEFKENGGAILGMQKGLGVTDEQLADMGKIAKSTGKTLTSSLIDMTKYATNLGKAFDVDFKVLSKGMAKASSDMSNFGSMSQKQIGVAVTYFAKLGVEVDKVTGVMDAFSTFDEAADKVSILNQVMGTNVEAMKMVNAEDPSERIEHLREQFAKAGIDGEKMSRAQRMMVKQLTSLDDAEQKLIFSSKNRGVSLAQIRKEGDKAEKKTMTQTEAMGKLADAMDRMLKSGEAKEGGFFGHFFQGFTDGLQRTKEFRELMTNIGKSLTVVYQAGIRLGKAFVDFFPGVKDFLGGLSDIFKPEKFKKLANGVVDVFVGFFKDLESGKASFPDLMERLKEKFFNFFDSEKGAGQKVMDGFKKIMMAIQVIVAGGVKWLLESVTGFIKNIVNFIKNPTDVPGVGGLADAASSYISPIGQAFKDGWKELGPALGELMGVLFDKLGEIILPKIKAFAADNLPIIAAVLFGPAALQAFLGAGTAMMSKAIGGMLTKAISGPDTQQLILKEMQGLSKTLQSTGAPNLAAPTSAID